MTRTPTVEPELQGRPAEGGSQWADFHARCELVTGRPLADLHAFSVLEAPLFWRTLLEWTDLPWSGSADIAVVGDDVETARFFPDISLNYAEALLRPLPGVDDDRPALTAVHAGRPAEHLSRAELRAAVSRTATALAGLGLRAGDRVAAVAPNNAGVVVAVLAAAALGATTSTATPDLGSGVLLGRLGQTQPRLIVLDRTSMDATTVVELVGGLTTLQAVLLLDDDPLPTGLSVPVHRLTDLVDAADPDAPVDWPRLPFAHPLFVMFSSGTTGPPKAMVHGAGGTLLEHVKEHRLHGDLRPWDTLYFHTTTAWMMWNWQLSALAVGAHVVVYDGPVLGPETLWQLVAEQGVTVFGTSPAYLQLCQDEGHRPAATVDLSRLRSVLSTGAVLHDWQFDWVAREVGAVPLQSISGGTDIIGCFLLGHPALPVRAGRCQARSLGLDVVAFGPDSTELVGGIGDLVCRRPFPSRPVGFLDDPDGARFHRAYFDGHPGVWTHGDLVEFDTDGSARLHGRSDGVLNVNGVRIGPAEVLTALRGVREVTSALAVEQRDPVRPGSSRMVLLVVLADGAHLDGVLEREVRRTLRREASAAHVPSLVVAVPELPMTHNGKTSERAARDAVNGDPVGNVSALRNPQSLDLIRAATLAADTAPAAPPPPVTRPAGDDEGPTGAVARIWAETLGLPGAEPEDHFFDLGGTSRQVMTLLRQVREEAGVDVPVTEFFSHPTLGDLLRATGPRPTDSRDAVVLLRAGTGRPVHLLVEGWRPLGEHADLAEQLDTGRPVYAVRPGAPDGRPHPVEEAAGRVVQAITAIQPEGPYTLLGHGLAGVVAHEAACRLSGSGAVVDRLVLVDTPAPATAVPAWRRIARRWADRLSAVRSADRGQQLWQRFVDRFAPATSSTERQEMLHARAAAAGHQLAVLPGPVLLVVSGSTPSRPDRDVAVWRRAVPGLQVVPGLSAALR